MFHSLIPFSTLAGGLFEEGHPPADMMTLNLGLTPFGVVVVVLLVMLIAWVALNIQAGRTDLHTAAAHGSHHDESHHDSGHHNDGHGH
ncbi:MAG: hypothetical protein Fur0022_49140 [Anaerolineales bacterium]